MATQRPTVRKVKRYGWIPDLPDARDHLFAAPPEVLAKLPAAVDLAPKCPPVYDQGELGSCTGNAIAAAIQFDRIRQDQPLGRELVPSRLFIYYNERVIEGTAGSDSGAQIRDGVKSVAKLGACFETGAHPWPYRIAQFTEKPSAGCYAAAAKHQIVQYSSVVPILAQLKGCLAAGFPFVFGFTVYESFESAEVAKSGLVPMPSPREHVLGGHAVLGVGYDDKTQSFMVRNSWSEKWGRGGYCRMPYAYLTSSHLARDFWTLRMVES
jgi:C1A family cysteine protease